MQRSRDRIAQQVRQLLDPARKLMDRKGDEFTTQDLVAEAGVALQTSTATSQARTNCW